MSRDDLELLRRGYDAFRSDGVDSALALMHPEIEIRVHTERPDMNRDVYTGREGFQANIAELTDVFADFRVEATEMVQEGERVMVVARVTGRGRGSGVAIDGNLFHVWTLRDGLAWRLEVFPEREQALQSLRG